jgi:dTDP-4-dehydrorhamnose 3,5-epimerase
VITVKSTALPDVKLVEVRRFEDLRGFFSEIYHQANFAAAGIDAQFVQDNLSLSRHAGTVRGLHFQTAPFAQAKLVRVVRGRILDVAVDIRLSSPTYGRHVAVEMGDEDGLQLFVPAGFAHGFCTLKPDTEVAYKVSAYYSPQHDKGLAWDDPDLDIAWPVSRDSAILSDKDRQHPALADLPAAFP